MGVVVTQQGAVMQAYLNGSAERAINSIEADSTGVSARESAEPNHATLHATMPARQARENTDKTIRRPLSGHRQVYSLLVTGSLRGEQDGWGNF